MKIFILATALLLGRLYANAQLALSGNDGKQRLLGEAPTSHTADNIAVIDLNNVPPKVIGSVAAPTSMIGPPVAVAVAHNGNFGLVTNGQKFSEVECRRSAVTCGRIRPRLRDKP